MFIYFLNLKIIINFLIIFLNLFLLGNLNLEVIYKNKAINLKWFLSFKINLLVNKFKNKFLV